MNIFRGFLTKSRIYKPTYFSTQSILNLNDLECKLTIVDRHYLGEKIYRKHYEYFNKNTNKSVCKLEFEIEPNIGRICILNIHQEYQNKTLGMQMINKVKEELKGKTDIIWGIFGSNEMMEWYENNKYTQNIKKIERDDNWHMYEINI
jgi:hypothetical protein